MHSFGYNFKNLRLEKNLTQDQLSQEFNEKYHYQFTKSTISQYENNKRIPELPVLMNFADYFEVTLDTLLGRDNFFVKEDPVSDYLCSSTDDHDLSHFIDYLKGILTTEDTFTLEGQPLSPSTLKLIKNCLDMTLLLAQKNQLE
ncbi:MAG: helix-turn-helix domain-containing protein [Cellulosilyticaceae bacterium]